MDAQFDGQRPGEKVVMVFRRHILTARKGFGFLIIASALAAVPMFLWPNDGKMIWILVAGIVIGLLGFGYALILWYFSLYIVTNQRMRQIVQKSMYKKMVVDLEYNKIETMEYKIPGLFGAIFGYGTLTIQTVAGEMKISMVAKVKNVYNNIQNEIGAR